jgi:replicative DNA helicase
MANVFDTRLLEQSLLRILSKDKMSARLYMHRAKQEMFITTQRQFIYDRMQRLFSDTNGLMTEALFEFEVKQSIKESEHSSYMAEWLVISGLDVEESPEAILDALEKALLAQKVSSICKDAAKLIQDGSVEEAVSLIRSESVMLGSKHDDIPFVEITDNEHRKQLIKDKQENPAKFLGIRSGFATYDMKTGGLFPAEVTLVSAVTGVGKSTFMKAVAANVITLSQKNVLHITNEESRAQVEMKYDALISGINYFSFKNATISPSEIDLWEDRINDLKKTNKYGRLFIKEIPHFDSCLSITKTYYELAQLGYKIDLIVVDYMDHLLPVVKSWSENDEQGKVAADIKALAVSLNIPVMTATQAATAAEAKQEKGRSFGKLDVYGSKRKVHSCNNLVFVIQEGRDMTQLKPPSGVGTYEDERECDCFWLIEVAKNRDGAPFFFKARQHVHSGRVSQIVSTGTGVAGLPGKMSASPEALASLDASKDFDKSVEERLPKQEEGDVLPEKDTISEVVEPIPDVPVRRARK